MSSPAGAGLLALGIQRFEAERWREAAELFRQALADGAPGDRLPAEFWLAATEYHLGDVGSARARLEAILAAGTPPLPERPGAVHEYLCRCHLRGDPGRAAELGREGILLDPRDARLRLITGNACHRLGRHDEALEHYDAGLAAEAETGPAFPRHPGQLPYARAAVLARLGRWAEALDAVDEAIRRDDAVAAYHNQRGVILFEGLDRAEPAVEAAARAAALDPECAGSGGDGVYHYNHAVYLDAAGRHQEALRAVDRAMALSPRTEYAALRDRLVGRVAAAAGSGPGAARVDFGDVGGMEELKGQVRRIIDVVHARRDEARRYGIVRNGILLYGPPGCGKSFFAEAVAGEFGLAFLRVPLGSVQTKYVGGAAEAIEKVFDDARGRLPCLLFFDEFDAVAGRRDDAGSQHEQHMVNALLQQIDAHRDVPGLVIAAATNRLDEIDPAIIRDGRFDYKVKVRRPDLDARRAILRVLLADRPHDTGVGIDGLAADAEGLSAAQLRHLVDAAAMRALERDAPITDADLRAALAERAGAGRYGGPRLEWDDLILDDAAKRRLQFIERFIESPQIVRALGIEPPTGVLLHGPPGTGKTTIARVLASQTDASFFAVNAADVFSKWFGESEARVRQLFEAARESVPAIVFIDEVDAVLGHRGGDGSAGSRVTSSVVNVFLAEMDGIASSRGVFVIAATNRPDLVDPAVLRPGRLSDTIEIGLPGPAERAALLRLFTGPLTLAEDLDLDALAAATDGASGADLRGLVTAAGRHALLRELDAASGAPAVSADDFEAALLELRPKGGEAEPARIGFRAG